MGAPFIEFLSAHGTVIFPAITLLAAMGIAQWRRAQVAERDLAFMAALLKRGLTAAEIVTLLRAKAATSERMTKLAQAGRLVAKNKMLLHANTATRPGRIEQFGALSGPAKLLVVVACTITAIMMSSIVSMSLIDLVSRRP